MDQTVKVQSGKEAKVLNNFPQSISISSVSYHDGVCALIRLRVPRIRWLAPRRNLIHFIRSFDILHDGTIYYIRLIIQHVTHIVFCTGADFVNDSSVSIQWHRKHRSAASDVVAGCHL